MISGHGGAHNVRIHTTGVKVIHHPVVGDLELPFESFPLAADPSQSLLTYTAEPGSPSQAGLSLLAGEVTPSARAEDVGHGPRMAPGASPQSAGLA